MAIINLALAAFAAGPGLAFSGGVLGVVTTNSITFVSPGTPGTALQLVGDTATPGASQFYGTSSLGIRGWYAISSTEVSSISGTAGQVLANGTAATPQTGAVTLTLDVTSAYAIRGNNSASSAVETSLQLLVLGTPGYTANAGSVLGQLTSASTSFNQFSIQNTSTGTAASNDFIVNNNLGSESVSYADFGINSSTYTGSAPLNIAGGAYLFNQSGDLSEGTVGNFTWHAFTNSVDRLTISGAGVITIPAFSVAGVLVNSAAGVVTSSTGTGAYVASVAGTANQITASAATGAVTLSLAGPHAFTTQTANALLTGNGTSALQSTGATMGVAGNLLTFAGGSSITDTSGAMALTATGANGISFVFPGSGGLSISNNTSTQLLALTATGVTPYNLLQSRSDLTNAVVRTLFDATGDFITYNQHATGGMKWGVANTQSSMMLSGLGNLLLGTTTDTTGSGTGSLQNAGGFYNAKTLINGMGATFGSNVSLIGATTAPVFTISGVNASAAPLITLTSNAGGGSQQSWIIGSNVSGTSGEFVIRDSTGSTTALTITKSTLGVSFASATSGTSTTAAAILGKSMGLTENLWVGGTINSGPITSTGVAGTLTLIGASDTSGLVLSRTTNSNFVDFNSNAATAGGAIPFRITTFGGTYNAIVVTANYGLISSHIANGTFTNNTTAANGTQVAQYGHVFYAPTIAATNTLVTTTTAATVVINGPPVVGTNMAFTNAYALYITRGFSLLGAGVTTGLVNVTTATASTSITSGCGIFAGGVGISGATWIGGLLNVAGNTTIQGSGGLTVNNGTQINGQLAIGTTISGASAIQILSTNLSGSTSQIGVNSAPTFQSTATASGYAVQVQLATAATSFTMVSGAGLHINSPNLGAGSVVTTLYGLLIDNQSGGASGNYAIRTGSGQVYFGDNVLSTKSQGWGVTSTVTAAGTTVLTIASTTIQVFTGSANQTVTLPAANAFGVGVAVVYVIKSRTTGSLVVTAAGADRIEGLVTSGVTAGSSATLLSDGVSAWVLA